jgi:hypothetical protein
MTSSSSTSPIVTETVEDLVKTIKQMLDKLIVEVEAVGCGRPPPSKTQGRIGFKVK